MQYKLNGFLWFGLGLFIEAVAGVFRLLDFGAEYYFTFIGITFAALIVEIIGISLVGNHVAKFAWGRGFVIISAILKALSVPLALHSISADSTGLLIFAAAISFAATVIQFLGVLNILVGCKEISETEGDYSGGKRFGFTWKLYLGLVVVSIVLGNFFSGQESTISISIGIASQLLVVIGAALISMRLIQLAATYNGKLSNSEGK